MARQQGKFSRRGRSTGNPLFRFKIISTFNDPLTRQLGESVRIDRRGTDILNSKSEYSRYRVPRLENEDQALIEELLILETDARRRETKINNPFSLFPSFFVLIHGVFLE